jgi:GT2 family glycosyltransferase
MSTPELSIVIPTHDRVAMLTRTLDSLAMQADAPRFETIVAADSCSDGTAAAIRQIVPRYPYPLRLFEHDARNPGATRNLGAARATTPYLLFLDDDIEAAPGLVRAHYYNRAENQVLLGYSKPAPKTQPSQWQMEARIWWEDRFRELAQRGHRFTYRDFFSGNFSIPADLFTALGGFDPTIGGRLEDYEFGLRLLAAGVRMRFCRAAAGTHHDPTDLPDWIRRIREEGASDVRISTLHPWLRPRLFSGDAGNRRERWLRRLAFACGTRGEPLVRFGLGVAQRLEAMRLRKRRNQVVWAVRTFNYWRGVASAAGGQPAFDEWRSGAPAPAGPVRDLPVYDVAAPPHGSELEQILERGTEIGLRIEFEGADVMTIAPDPAAEPLRPEHIDLIVRDLARTSFVPAIARQFVRHGGVAL